MKKRFYTMIKDLEIYTIVKLEMSKVLFLIYLTIKTLKS